MKERQATHAQPLVEISDLCTECMKGPGAHPEAIREITRTPPATPGRDEAPIKERAVGTGIISTVCEGWKSVAIAQEDRARPSRRGSPGPERGPPKNTKASGQRR